MASIKIAALQIAASGSKEQDLETVHRYLEGLRGERPDYVVLPEMFCCPYETSCFPEYAEPAGGPTWQTLSFLAREFGIYLIGGSMPESDAAGHVYNTSYVFDRSGHQIGQHRKAHLFDIDVKGGQYFKESDTLTAGNAATVFDTQFGRMGVMICYDIRFPEMARLMVNDGARVIFVPAAFNMTTGPAHWELTFRARALDNQVYMVGCAPCRVPESGYVSWGHSIVTNPWGEVIAQLDEKEGVLLASLDLDRIDSLREQLPLLTARRHDMYRLERLCPANAGGRHCS